MVKGELAEVWAEALQLIERQLTRPSYEAWLRNTRPLSLEDGRLVLAVPNQFARDWVLERCSTAIVDSLRRVLGHDVRLEVVVEPQPAPAAGQVAATSEAALAPGTPAGPAADAGSSWRTLSQPLNPKYTFETFVTGSGNRLAHAAALAVAEAPARTYNPLFIYGGVGLGKTHLMQAVAHHVLRKHGSRVAYVSCETFTNEMINAIRDGKTLEFRNRYRNVDVLLVDDIQFLAGKESTQEEFFHTFNALHEANRQIVISSDRPPKEIPTLEERLRSRFEWGLISDIQPPDFETRVAILRKKAQLEKLRVPDDVIAFIAERIDTNIRELEGALIRLVAFASLTNHEIDLDLAAEVLKDILPPPRANKVTIARIQEVVAEYYGVKVRDLKARRRTRAIAFPRQVAMYLCRELTEASLPRIGEEFGGRDHTTVLHAYEKISQDVRNDPQLGRQVKELMELIRKG
ncbi:chromosomal replication initiator protein DnaA [Thermaerobacter subterraneus]|uniref:Chromosomal replication initiator protein DnaA n=1 Tax=Thermaerobacter subterraneus DSM 13965 TaxID=867903 RepID=K6Q1D2_9FIRM|nr:chromosomal replication initiator protein DnaA [Thermaerobacter subterraneus]EKP94764.1 chromosomal replication initiator protein DnaA [Thermaerobacter subterraneus DSM 13965]